MTAFSGACAGSGMGAADTPGCSAGERSGTQTRDRPPAGWGGLELTRLPQGGGGEVGVGGAVKAEGEAWLATKPYFEVVVSLEGESVGTLPLGSRGQIRFGAKMAPIGVAAYRGAIRFLRSFAQS